MKKNKIKLLILSVIVGSIGFASFKIYQKVVTVKESYTEIMNTIFYPSYGEEVKDSIKYNMDAMLIRKDEYDKTYYVVPYNNCGTNLNYLAYDVRLALGGKQKYDDNFDAQKAFKQTYGVDLNKAPLNMAITGYNKKPIPIPQYNATALQTAFDKLYKKPTESFDGIGLQMIYNISLKEYFRNLATSILKIYNNKDFVATAAKFKKAATTDKEFYAYDFTTKHAAKFIGKEPEYVEPAEGEEYVEPCLSYYKEKDLMAVLFRRHIDGTLPTIIKNMKTVLKDYDPDFYKTLK